MPQCPLLHMCTAVKALPCHPTGEGRGQRFWCYDTHFIDGTLEGRDYRHSQISFVGGGRVTTSVLTSKKGPLLSTPLSTSEPVPSVKVRQDWAMKLGLRQPQPQDLSWLPPVPMDRRPEGQSLSEGRGLRHHQFRGARKGVCLGMGWLMGTLRVLGPGQQPPSIPELVAPVMGAMETREACVEEGWGGGEPHCAPPPPPADQFPPLGTAPLIFQM